MEQLSKPCGDVDIVEERDPHAYGFTIKAHVNGLLHRVLPLRDPHQPRYWCVVVYRCSSGGLADLTEPPWIGARGLRREDLKEVMGAIRADPSAWLAESANDALRDWVLAHGTPDATTIPQLFKDAAPSHAPAS
jgi:hypothetical protein